MYVQITTRCNMKCGHCCYSCGPKGVDMDRLTFLKACKFAEDWGDGVFLGGGEPTVHPLFWDFVGIALGATDPDNTSGLGVITNGKLTEDALRLARLARNGVLYAAVSRDSYHQRIDPKVIAAFKRQAPAYGDRNNDLRDIREMRTVFDVGRAKRRNLGGEKRCVCPELFVDPQGTLWGCGCRTVRLGTLDWPTIPDEWDRGACHGIEGHAEVTPDSSAEEEEQTP